MGAFAIDIPLGGFLEDIKTRSYTVGFCLFTALAGLGFVISILHFRQLSEREAAASQVNIQNARFNAALNNMTQGLCMFDADKRLVVSNDVQIIRPRRFRSFRISAATSLIRCPPVGR